MAGPLSGHIINSYESSMNQSNQSICTDGLISFNPSMHGSFNPNMHSTQRSFSFSNPSPASTSMSESTYDRVNRLQTKLNQKLGPEFISQRPGPGGGPKLTYAEGWKVINVANEVFGFDGWSSNIVSLTTDYMDYNAETRRYNVGVSAVMRVTLKEGVFHEDVGYGMIENAKAKGMALDKCKKEAVTDGLKRTLRTFGNVLGNCLYDKQYTAEIVKIKVPPMKLEKSELYRLPELSEKPPAGASISAAASSASASRSSITATSTPVRAPMPAPVPAPQQQRWQPQQQQQQPAKPISSVPRHMQTTGLQTPITTPAPATVPERKVSFAPQTKPPQAQMQIMQTKPPHAEDEAESFGFFSDDDAFLACVDMGEGDLGRPIEYEESGESSAVSGSGGGGDEGEQQSRVPQVSPPQQQEADRFGPMGLGRTGTGTGTRAGPQQQWGAMNPPPPPNPPQQQQQQRVNVVPRAQAQKPNSGGSSSASSSRAAAILNATRGVTGAAPSASTSTTNQNQNQKGPTPPSSRSDGAGSASTSTSTSAPAPAAAPAPAPAPAPAKRPSTPSAGAFHFPPGMNTLLQQQQSNGKPPPMLPPPQGVKRGADAMIASSTRTGASAGLGLSGAGAGGTARQPLGTLALDGQQQQQQYQQQGGSDLKRVRR